MTSVDYEEKFQLGIISWYNTKFSKLSSQELYNWH